MQIMQILSGYMETQLTLNIQIEGDMLNPSYVVSLERKAVCSSSLLSMTVQWTKCFEHGRPLLKTSLIPWQYVLLGREHEGGQQNIKDLVDSATMG